MCRSERIDINIFGFSIRWTEILIDYLRILWLSWLFVVSAGN